MDDKPETILQLLLDHQPIVESELVGLYCNHLFDEQGNLTAATARQVLEAKLIDIGKALFYRKHATS